MLRLYKIARQHSVIRFWLQNLPNARRRKTNAFINWLQINTTQSSSLNVLPRAGSRNSLIYSLAINENKDKRLANPPKVTRLKCTYAWRNLGNFLSGFLLQRTTKSGFICNIRVQLSHLLARIFYWFWLKNNFKNVRKPG